MQPIRGIHHITAIAKNPQANVDFYHQVLGQRLVKKTVNFDDPGTYHFYYGDKIGTPGTIMTFFPWRYVQRGKRGNGEVAATAYTIHAASLSYWQDRFKAHQIPYQLTTRFGCEALILADPEGTSLELIVHHGPATIDTWDSGPVPMEHALRGFHSVTLWIDSSEATAALLTEVLGFTLAGEEGNRLRFQAASNDIGLFVDLLVQPRHAPAQSGAGSVHHVAFRTRDDTEQLEYQQAIAATGLGVTDVRDRQYFHSIYFREPSGVLFEVATDAPGFLYDEPVDQLGQNLKLPPWLEQHRARIVDVLPHFTHQSHFADEARS